MENNQKKLILLKDLGMKYPKNTSNKKTRYGLYKCFCGVEFETQTASIKNDKTKSCGCSRITHNLTKHRLYKTWNNMFYRCNNPKSKDYKDYGGRGIIVCQEWHNVENFINDMYPSFVEGLTLDRENVNGNYCKDNCRWTNQLIQARNTRILNKTNTSGYRGVSKTNNNRYKIRISVNNERIHIGTFDNLIDGAKAYDKYVIDNNLEHTLNFNRE